MGGVRGAVDDLQRPPECNCERSRENGPRWG
jgi:hypothetical protein